MPFPEEFGGLRRLTPQRSNNNASNTPEGSRPTAIKRDLTPVRRQPRGQRTPAAHELPRGLLVIQLAGGSERTLQTEAVCEFIIVLNRPAASCERFWRNLPKSFRKEVIQPQVPLRLPCYDLVPVTELTFGRAEVPRLRVFPAPMT